MKIFLLFLAGFLILSNGNAQQKLQLLSPDKTIRIEIKAEGKLKYSVFLDDKNILDDCLIDMRLANGISLSADLKKVKEISHSVHETIVAQVPYSRRYIPDEYNERILQFNNHFSVIFRAYNDGVAYRIVTSFPDSIIVLSETAGFQFKRATHAYGPVIQKREGLDVFHTSFEELYPYKSLDSLSKQDFMFSPVLTKTSESIFVAITESDLDDYPGMFLQGTGTDALNGAYAAYPMEEKIAEGDYPEMVVSKRA